MAEIEDRFALCVADPSMRSVSAVLRVTREQLDSRGQLGHYPTLAWIAALLTIACVAALPFLPVQLSPIALKGAGGGALIFCILLAGALRVRHARVANRYQEQKIREAAVSALVAILAHDPVLKPLTREQRDTVRDLSKRCKVSQELASLLN